MSASHAIPVGRVGTLRNPDMWLVSPKYDLLLIIFSSALLAFPHIARTLYPSTIFVDLIVTMLIGGPHLFSPWNAISRLGNIGVTKNKTEATLIWSVFGI